MDSIRIEHAKSLIAALEKYRAARGPYPSPFDNDDIADLKIKLVDPDLGKIGKPNSQD